MAHLSEQSRHCRENPERPRGIVLVVIDALRPDHLGCYGYGRQTSPALDRLAADGIVFDQAFSPAGWTRPAIASLFTSLFPLEHGLRHRAHYRSRELILTRLDERFTTLAERFAEAGYATLGVVGNPFLQRRHGFQQGFDQFFQAERDAAQVLEAFDGWLRARKPDRFFAYLHFMDVHWPYAPPSPYDQQFGSPERARKFTDVDWDILRTQMLKAKTVISPEDRDGLVDLYDGLVDLYDGGIRYVDDRLGDYLREQGRETRDWLIVVTADHGEELLEHGNRMGHGPFLYDVNLRIPLLIRLPGGRHGAPAALITAFITEAGVLRPPFKKSFKRVKGNKNAK